MSLAPLAIVVDPFRLGEVRLDDPDDDVAYLYRKQIEEADVVLTSRADLDAPDVRARIEAIRPGVQVLAVSGTTGRGVEAWLASRARRMHRRRSRPASSRRSGTRPWHT